MVLARRNPTVMTGLMPMRQPTATSVDMARGRRRGRKCRFGVNKNTGACLKSKRSKR